MHPQHDSVSGKTRQHGAVGAGQLLHADKHGPRSTGSIETHERL